MSKVDKVTAGQNDTQTQSTVSAKRGFDWTVDARIERLTKMWNDGVTAADISKRLGPGCTKNAVVGKVHRLGLKLRASPIRRRGKAEEPTGVPEHLRHTPLGREMRRKGFVPGTVTLNQLELSDCRYPTNEAAHGEAHLFCGLPALPGKPYCETHAARCYVPNRPPRKKDDERPTYYMDRPNGLKDEPVKSDK
jgi:GcrA cell cycle regulator